MQFIQGNELHAQHLELSFLLLDWVQTLTTDGVPHDLNVLECISRISRVFKSRHHISWPIEMNFSQSSFVKTKWRFLTSLNFLKDKDRAYSSSHRVLVCQLRPFYKAWNMWQSACELLDNLLVGHAPLSCIHLEFYTCLSTSLASLRDRIMEIAIRNKTL